MSMSMPFAGSGGNVIVAPLPAASVQLPLTWSLCTSVLIRIGCVTKAICVPPAIGVQLNVTVTAWSVQVPGVYGWPPAVADAVITGALLLMLMPLKVELALFPATSVQVAVTDWLLPGLFTVTASGFVPLVVVDEAVLKLSVFTPEPPSVQLNVTVTSWLVGCPKLYGWVPLPFGIVALVAITGGVLSSQIATVLPGCVLSSTLPALSVAKKFRFVLPSTVMFTVVLLTGVVDVGMVCPGPPPAGAALIVICLTPEPPGLSVALSATITFLLVQVPKL